MPGVHHVVPIQSGIFSGVAVVAGDTWDSNKGRDALEIQWEKGKNADFDSDRFIDRLKAAFDRKATRSAGRGIRSRA